MFIDIARAIAETIETTEPFEQSSAAAQGLTLFCLLV